MTPSEPTAENSRAGYRLLGLAVLVGVALLVVPFITRRRANIDVDYRFGEIAPRVVGARIGYLPIAADGRDQASAEEALSLAWEFGQSGSAPAQKTHHANLAPGDFRIAIRLRFADGSWHFADTQISIVPVGQNRVLVDLPSLLAAPAPAKHRLPTQELAPNGDTAIAL